MEKQLSTEVFIKTVDSQEPLISIKLCCIKFYHKLNGFSFMWLIPWG